MQHVARADEGNGADDDAGRAIAVRQNLHLCRGILGTRHDMGAEAGQQAAAFAEHSNRIMVAA